MRRLRALDAAFLYAETATAPMHAAALQIFEPAASGEDFFQGFREHVRPRIALLPHLHEHLHETPLALDHPVWVAGSHVDLARHVHLDRLPPPGSLTQLTRVVLELVIEKLAPGALRLAPGFTRTLVPMFLEYGPERLEVRIQR
jgi:hypothetical protein